MIFWIKLLVCLIGAILILVLLCGAIVHLYSRPHLVEEQSDLVPAEAVIILGAGVRKDGSLSPILKERVDTAVSIYQAGLAKKILMSGDNGSRYYNEVSPVHAYLTELGIPPEDLFLDYAGFDTYDTMYRARAVFEVESGIVVTQDFHLPRAVFIASAMGMKVQGFAADGEVEGRHLLREALARVKAVLEVRIKRSPTYLGQKIPISGDGRESLGE